MSSFGDEPAVGRGRVNGEFVPDSAIPDQRLHPRNLSGSFIGFWPKPEIPVPTPKRS